MKVAYDGDAREKAVSMKETPVFRWKQLDLWAIPLGIDDQREF